MISVSWRIMIICGLLLLSGCAGSLGETPQPDDDSANVSMRLQWIPQYQFAGYIVAQMKGYYPDAGLTVDLRPGGPDFVPMPLVASGSDTFGSTGADTIFLARQRGVPVVALATIFQASPVGFMVHDDSNITMPQDFIGRRVGVFYGDNVETEYRAMLAATGVDRRDIDEIPASVHLEPFLSRRIEVWPVYITDQPFLARQQGASVDLIVARDYDVFLMGDVLFTTEQVVREHPDITRAFVAATLDGWHDATENLDETITLVAEYNQYLSTEHLHFEGTATIPLVEHGIGARCIGWNDPIAWEAEQQILLDLGILNEAIPIDEAIDNRFVADYYRDRGIRCPAPLSES